MKRQTSSKLSSRVWSMFFFRLLISSTMEFIILFSLSVDARIRFIRNQRLIVKKNFEYSLSIFSSEHIVLKLAFTFWSFESLYSTLKKLYSKVKISRIASAIYYIHSGVPTETCQCLGIGPSIPANYQTSLQIKVLNLGSCKMLNVLQSYSTYQFNFYWRLILLELFSILYVLIQINEQYQGKRQKLSNMIIDRIFDDKIGIGPAQYYPLFFLTLIDLNDGAQLILSSFLTPIIQHQWDLSQTQASTLTSIFYLGIFFGSITSGKLSDTHGRKPIIIIGSIFQIVVSLSFFLVNNYFQMGFARFLYGFTYGFTVAITTSVFAEITPKKYRGKGILLLNFCISIGKLYGLLLAYIFLDGFVSGNWRTMMICSGFPNLFVLVGSLYFLRQSPRFLIAHNQLEEAYTILDQMIKKNNPEDSELLTENQKIEIQQYHDRTFLGKQKASFTSLFDSYYWKTTVCLSVCWFSLNFMYYGQLVSLPFIFGKVKKTFSSYAFTVFGQIPSFILSIFLVDRPNFGRKNSLLYFFILSGLMFVIFSFNLTTFFSSAARFFMKMCFQMIYPCTTQSYATINRTLGFGFNSAIGRLGATIMPYIILPLVDINIPLIFWFFALFAGFGATAAYILPHQTLGRSLDYQTESQASQVEQEVSQERRNGLLQ